VVKEEGAVTNQAIEARKLLLRRRLDSVRELREE